MHKLFHSYNGLGNRYLQERNLRKARLFYERALKIITGIVEHDPGNIEAQQYLASTFNSIGVVFKHRCKRKKSREYLEKACHILEVVTSLNPSNLESVWERGKNLRALVEVCRELEDMEAALRYHKEAVEAGELLAEIDPENREYQKDLADRYGRDRVSRKRDQNNSPNWRGRSRVLQNPV